MPQPSPEAFIQAVLDCANHAGTDYVVTMIPGVYELVQEHFNNDALKHLQSAAETNEDTDATT